MSSIYKHSNGIFRVGIMLTDRDGVRKQVVRSLQTKNYKEAIQKAEELEKELTAFHLHEVLCAWSVQKMDDGRSHIYLDHADRIMNEFIAYAGNVAICTIKIDNLREYKNHLYKKGNNDTTVSIKLRYLKAIFNYAYKRDWIVKSPFRGLEIPKSKTRQDFLDKEQIRELLKLIKDPLHKGWVELLLQSGMRLDEFQNLAYEDDTIKW